MANAVDVTPAGIVASANFTPAAAAYGAADIIGASTEMQFTFTASGVAIPRGSLVRILTSIVKIDQTAVISGETSYTLHLYRGTQPSAQADNDAWTLASADLTAYAGSLALGTPADLGAACYVKTQFSDVQDFRLTGDSLWGRLVTAGAFTATAVARQVSVYGILL